ncbi:MULTISPECIES: phosphoribosylanthranilate isomerase [unclassified Paenibacillus]|uniref:phosphoribosylanthranilate isomerase n=1 Tax=unclassified Paenibacillus TaxID=185978 RepID=UPI001C0FEDB6|nr:MULTISPECIES: phosphoribosylanthranilate isomerase [unclassified Paenibacillus]MBU5443978.1 phosphoribosylanthranilate isomerase [Paenibacillus sp. MSJ-34]CAH0118759.1 N-(5'-phosphoribosyl)anthranilate isomerase [Paenibacillus sp. CECT 9249]
MTATVKICGLQTVELLESMINLPVDQVGFVFAKSKRQVDAEKARTMIDFIRAQKGFAPLTVGVFVNPAKEELQAVLSKAELDVVQLHGQETPEFCRWVKETFGVQVYKSCSIATAREDGGTAASGAENAAGVAVLKDGAMERIAAYAGAVDAILLDTYDPEQAGGSGKAFAWDRIPRYQAWAREAGVKLLVAGGLDADNVAGLIEAYGPDGVDVSSGVETDGVKDIAKITAFVERVKIG